MSIKYNLGQRFVASVSVLLISLFLQSCNQFSNPLIPIIDESPWLEEDNQQLDSPDSLKEGEDKNLITQGGNQKDIQKIVTNNNPTSQVDISIIDKEKKNHPMLGKRMQPDVIITKPFEIATITPRYSQEAGIQKYRKLTDLKLDTKQTIGSPLGKFDILPRDLLPGILSYLESKELGQVRQLNKFIYKLTTGYEQPGMVGVENKPSSNRLALSLNTHTVDFKKIQGLMPETISSFAFYQLMGQVKNLPSIFWAHIQGTNIHTINLGRNQIGTLGAAELVKNLQGTSVHTIHLGYNGIGASGAAELAKNLKGTSVHTIDLRENQIGDSGAAELVKNLQGTSVYTIHLDYNQIGDSGAAELAKNLKGTSVHTIYLGSNEIGASGAAWFAKNLQGTSVHTIDLGANEIGALGAAELAKNLQGTSIHTINLEVNEIGASGAAELAKNLQGTSVHTIRLTYNKIGDSGAAELAKNLKGTNVHTVNLARNEIGPETQNLLKQQYTHIRWTF
jgi:hypothetical protein